MMVYLMESENKKKKNIIFDITNTPILWCKDVVVVVIILLVKTSIHKQRKEDAKIPLFRYQWPMQISKKPYIRQCHIF